jgi:hypothetical protein
VNRFAAPICLCLALAMIVAGFAVWAVEMPTDSVDLHRVRAEGNERFEKVLKEDLSAQRRTRRLLIGGLFGGAALMVVISFWSMTDRRR